MGGPASKFLGWRGKGGMKGTLPHRIPQMSTVVHTHGTHPDNAKPHPGTDKPHQTIIDPLLKPPEPHPKAIDPLEKAQDPRLKTIDPLEKPIDPRLKTIAPHPEIFDPHPEAADPHHNADKTLVCNAPTLIRHAHTNKHAANKRRV